jgi:3',5'-cyclic-nucleotide phosphodiesterase
VELRVLGCHGGETPKHRTSAFLIDERLAVDAGALTSGADLETQSALDAVLVSHAHLDHVRDLATLADNRSQAGAPPLPIVGTASTLAALKKHFFNDLLWPDFSRLPSRRRPAIRYVKAEVEVPMRIAGYTVRAISVHHAIDCCAFVITGSTGSLAYSGDTGPTKRLWEVLNATPDLKALLMEVSLPNSEGRLARASGHHTPETLARDMGRLHRARDLPTLLYHIKPTFQAVVEKQCAKLRGLNLSICAIGDQFLL